MCVAFFENVIPEGLAKEPPEMLKIPNCLDLIDFTMVLFIATCEFNANNKHRCIQTHLKRRRTGSLASATPWGM